MKKAFEVNKVRRLLKTQGQLFEFQRLRKNPYGEIDPSRPVWAKKLLGVYHETFARPVLSSAEGSSTRTLPQPNILCLWDEYLDSEIAVGDELIIDGNKYILQSAVDIQKAGVAAELVLRQVDDGGTEF